jgi:GNAT superfamily N-acetyltransferase
VPTAGAFGYLDEVSPSPASEFVVRRATGADRALVLAIIGEMWKCDQTVRYEWLYARNPHGRALTWLVVEKGSGDVVAITSVFPRRVALLGREHLGSIGGDCYVLPRARRKGLATLLHRACFEQMHAEGVEFMYGPPRPNNLSALVKAGSNAVTVFRRATRPLTGSQLVMQAVKRSLGPLDRLADVALRMLDRAMRPPRGYSLERVQAFGPHVTSVMDRVACTHRIFPVRDAEWLEWRYFAGPTRSQRVYGVRRYGELAGLVALEQEGPLCVVIDVAVPAEEEVMSAAVALIVAEAKALGARVVEASFTPSAPIVARLGRLGFVPRGSVGFQVALAEGAGVDAAERAELLTESAWTFSTGDKDADTLFAGDLPE